MLGCGWRSKLGQAFCFPITDGNRTFCRSRNCKSDVQTRTFATRNDFTEMTARKPNPVGKEPLGHTLIRQICSKFLHRAKFAHGEQFVKGKCSLCAILVFTHIEAKFAL